MARHLETGDNRRGPQASEFTQAIAAVQDRIKRRCTLRDMLQRDLLEAAEHKPAVRDGAAGVTYCDSEGGPVFVVTKYARKRWTRRYERQGIPEATLLVYEGRNPHLVDFRLVVPPERFEDVQARIEQLRADDTGATRWVIVADQNERPELLDKAVEHFSALRRDTQPYKRNHLVPPGAP